MIQAVETTKGTKAITSDHWHVVHSRCTDNGGRVQFVRSVHSEHDARGACVEAAKRLWAILRADESARPAAQRDAVFVCRPNYKSLERSRHRRPRKG
ncbi:MAG: hypothetical protein KF830_03150 [Planctomycetes bacterium]|nr:hypothetical protein [Planctomycetota bacterium]MBX3634913.1 hypothetical protein [Rubrivivax sp.]